MERGAKLIPRQIGLLPKDNPEQIPLAYKLYKSNDSNGRELAAGFKKTFCRSVLIEFVGVWYAHRATQILYA